MGKKNKVKQGGSSNEQQEDAAAAVAAKKMESDDESSVSSEEDEDDLILEGVLVRNPDNSDDSSSSSDDDDSDSAQEEEEEGEGDAKLPPAASKKSNRGNLKCDDDDESSSKNNNKKRKQQCSKQNKSNKKKKKKKQKNNNEEGNIEIIPVDFTFCDMNEKYFHGLKTLVASTSPIYSAYSSELSDLMIENVSVGTVVGCDMGGDPDTVFGFASVLNVTTYGEKSSIQALKKLCLDKCPQQHQKELSIVLSGQTKRPAGFYLHGRMVNLPIEIVEVLHQQLVLDMDWAVKNAEGGEAERKSLDFGAFVRVAPTYKASNVTYYKHFDDEVFADHSEFKYEIQLPKTYGMEETPYCMVIVMTKTGHRAAMKSISNLVQGQQQQQQG